MLIDLVEVSSRPIIGPDRVFQMFFEHKESPFLHPTLTLIIQLYGTRWQLQKPPLSFPSKQLVSATLFRVLKLQIVFLDMPWYKVCRFFKMLCVFLMPGAVHRTLYAQYINNNFFGIPRFKPTIAG